MIVGPAGARRIPLRAIGKALAATLIIGLVLLRLAVAELIVLRGNHMAPSVLDGDLLLLRHDRAPGMGDIVLVDLGGVVTLRRIVGVPGDRMSMVGGLLARNDVKLNIEIKGSFTYFERGEKAASARRQLKIIEDLAPDVRPTILGDYVGAARPFLATMAPIEVPPLHFLVLCDNRRTCPPNDLNGLVPEDQVLGIATAVVWYGEAWGPSRPAGYGGFEALGSVETGTSGTSGEP
ncbi:MAG: signal peptidase I [Myxococcales bacterium]|nr:signal peptidase I [Myxococcales bacterium]